MQSYVQFSFLYYNLLVKVTPSTYLRKKYVGEDPEFTFIFLSLKSAGKPLPLWSKRLKVLTDFGTIRILP